MISLANAGDINGITLTKEDVTLIIQAKKNALTQTGRFEFGKSPYEMLLRALPTRHTSLHPMRER